MFPSAQHGSFSLPMFMADIIRENVTMNRLYFLIPGISAVGHSG